MAVYKDDLYAAKCRLERLRCGSAPGTAVPQELVKLYAYRHARIWGAAVGMLGFVLLLFDLLGGARFSTHILLLSWMVMGLVFGVALGAAALRLRRDVARADAPSISMRASRPAAIE